VAQGTRARGRGTAKSQGNCKVRFMRDPSPRLEDDRNNTDCAPSLNRASNSHPPSSQPPTGPLGLVKLGKLVSRDCGTCFGQQTLVISQVVDREQDWAEHLSSLEKMPQIPATVAASRAGALFFQWLWVMAMARITESDGP